MLRPPVALFRAATLAAAALLSATHASPDDGAWGPPAPAHEEALRQVEKPTSPDGRRTLKRLPVNFLRSIGGLVSTDNAIPFLVGGGLTAGSFALDDTVREQLEGEDIGGLRAFGDKLGDVEVVVPLTAGMLVIGRLAGNQRFRDMSYDFAQAQIAVGALGGLLKAAVGRERPNGSNNHSFPSGHSYSWFTNASVVERHYGIWAALPVYGVWAIVGVSRIEGNAHYFSDVVGGAALGYLIARTTRRVNDAPLAETGPARQSTLRIMPWVPAGDRGAGVLVRLEF